MPQEPYGSFFLPYGMPPTGHEIFTLIKKLQFLLESVNGSPGSLTSRIMFHSAGLGIRESRRSYEEVYAIFFFRLPQYDPTEGTNI